VAELCAAGVTLRNQVNKRWESRDKASDGWIGDAAHAARESDHNPDANGIVRAIDLDEDFRGDKGDAKKFADELIALARARKDGGRLKYVVYEDKIASGTYADSFWVWRGSGYGHTQHIHVSFTEKGDKDGKPFALPILAPKPEALWDKKVPPFETVLKAYADDDLRSAAAYRVAARLFDLGFYGGAKPVEYEQGFPHRAYRAWALSKGRPFHAYDRRSHLLLFGGVR
jgi:hypothetical protein